MFTNTSHTSEFKYSYYNTMFTTVAEANIVLKLTSHTPLFKYMPVCDHFQQKHHRLDNPEEPCPWPYSSSTAGEKQFLHYPWYTMPSATSGK